MTGGNNYTEDLILTQLLAVAAFAAPAFGAPVVGADLEANSKAADDSKHKADPIAGGHADIAKRSRKLRSQPLPISDAGYPLPPPPESGSNTAPRMYTIPEPHSNPDYATKLPAPPSNSRQHRQIPKELAAYPAPRAFLKPHPHPPPQRLPTPPYTVSYPDSEQ
ncbi:hypothetical protein PspLS_01562 [Pyricularia sp. CBS 133598]|nr:hypothetical protein PspLS_01564 [Pyricularia sp. CBS 133598]TLD34245.1 hypothetical protein PspLS_01562 [Pyricularia sp. CBS 133598]